MAKRRMTDKSLAAALKATFGNVTIAARNVGMERESLSRRVSRTPALRQLVADARESMLDNAESALGRAVLNGEAWAVCFLLKTQGKGRGYIERQEIRQETRLAVSMSAEELTDDELAAIASRGSPRAIAPPASPQQPD